MTELIDEVGGAEQYAGMSRHSFTTSSNHRGGIVVIVLVIVSVVVVAAGASAGVYFWRQHKINQLNDKIDTLSAQLQQQQGQPNNPPPPSSPQASNNSTSSNNSYTSEKGVQVIVYAPVKGAKVTSPVGVIGKVPGNWSFEASFPLKMLDVSGSTIAQGMAQVVGDWMTTQLVPFSGKLTYTGTPSGGGTLELLKDNPSGQPSNDDIVKIPIEF